MSRWCVAAFFYSSWYSPVLRCADTKRHLAVVTVMQWLTRTDTRTMYNFLEVVSMKIPAEAGSRYSIGDRGVSADVVLEAELAVARLEGFEKRR